MKTAKRRMCSFLRTTNRTVVFFIDNFDRATDDNIIFMFKLIATIFDLPGVVFVLSFDRERIDNVIKNTQHFNPKFVEKIIQQEIKVPMLPRSRAETVFYTCLSNLLQSYGVPLEESKDFVQVAHYIVERTPTIRAFKRLINSVFPVVFCNDLLLNKSDMLGIEAIRFFDPELFYEIYKNSKFFISHDKSPGQALKLGANREDFNEKGKEFFDTLFLNHPDSLELLSAMFPYVKRYEQKNQLEQHGLLRDPNSAVFSKQSRICSGKYFDLYFSYGTNHYISMKAKIEGMISNLNQLRALSPTARLVSCEKILRSHLLDIGKGNHEEWVKQLQNYVSDVHKDCVFPCAVSLYSLIYEIEEEQPFFGLSAQSRAEYIISLLFENCPEDKLDEFFLLTEEDYKKLQVIDAIHYWLSSDMRDNSETRERCAKRFEAHGVGMCERIISGNISLYDKEYYRHENIWVLYRYFKKNNNTEGFLSYISGLLAPENVYRVLWDITTASVGSEYRYSINKETYDVFINDDEALDHLLERCPPRNKAEELVLQIYKSYKEDQPDVWGHTGITSPTRIALIL